MKSDRIAMLQDTLDILDRGFYQLDGKTIPLKLSREQMEEAEVFLPRDVQRISEAKDFEHVRGPGRCGYGCENMDSFTLARKRAEQFSRDLKREGAKPVLVLNLANPVNPGGGVRRGAKAQEEDLCRKSSLLVSLESVKARTYYDYNRSLGTYMGSHAIIIDPQVEIIKDENGDLLPESVIVAVLTCAAPMLSNGMEGMSQEQYETMVYDRITGMLKVAAYLGYKHLILGAFGCGAFGNDARIVSDLFCRALKEFNYDGMRESDMFRSIDFAVLSRSAELYNFREFSRNFAHFYGDENQEEINRAPERKKETETHPDAVRGCGFGGAAGDAPGCHDSEWAPKHIDMHRPGRKQPMVFFWKDDEENGCFSNWFRRKFVIDDFEYLFVEQYMMAQKAKLFHDSEHYTAILRATQPWECKELGRQVKPFDSQAWSAVKYDVVKTANRAKYEQNPDLMAKLIETGDAILAEASPKDTIWGIGLDAAAAAETSPSEWPGQNLLGKILMELRAEFAAKKTETPETVR